MTGGKGVHHVLECSDAPTHCTGAFSSILQRRVVSPEDFGPPEQGRFCFAAEQEHGK
jgi:hypothetical protein